jgi:paired amphipathic helix protein Sin3a
VSADPLDDMITVTTPSGTITQSTTASTTLPRLSRDIPVLPGHTNTNAPTFPGILPALGPDSLSRSHTPHALLLHGQQPPFDPSFSPGFQNPQTAAAASVLGNLNNNRNPVERQPPGEFNHAIHYLNKIKARYADDPNTYKQFLDILQTYQKEQRQLHDVSGHNMSLFEFLMLA